MRRPRHLVVTPAALAVSLGLALSASFAAIGGVVPHPASAQTEEEPAGTGSDLGAPTTAEPEAYILVDADTGRVIAGKDEHTPRAVGGIAKVVTAVTAVERLDPEALIAPGPRAIAAPRRSLNGDAETSMAEGQQWKVQDLIAGIIIESANDAAYALAEAMGDGDVNVWSEIAQRTLDRLGKVDQSFVLDPAGIDDGSGVSSGPIMSPYDVAIVARNALESPVLSALMTETSYDFVGGDEEVRTLENTNELVDAGIVGLTGMKVGFTELAGPTVIATAERGGRSMIVVMLNVYGAAPWAAQFLAQGFETDPAAQPGEQLPAVGLSPYLQRVGERDDLLAIAQGTDDTSGTGVTVTSGSTESSTDATTETTAETASESGDSGGSSGMSRWLVPLLFLLLVGYVVRVVQVRTRRNRRRADRRHRERMMRRGSLPVIEPPMRGADRNPQSSSSHVRVRRFDEPDNLEEPWDGESWEQ